MKKVILDTNALMLPFQFGLELKSEISRALEEPYEIAIPSGALLELEGIASGKSRDAMFAKSALSYWRGEIEAGNAKLIESRGKVDDWIVHTAASPGTIVCTSDSGVRKRLKAGKRKAVVLRERNRLVVV